MKSKNLLVALLLGVSIFNAQAAVSTAGAIAASSAAQHAATTTIMSSVTSNMMNTQNSVVVECILQKVRKDDEWFGRLVPSLKETINSRDCQDKKEVMEQLNNTHYKFGKVKGIFDVNNIDYVTIELNEVR